MQSECTDTVYMKNHCKTLMGYTYRAARVGKQHTHTNHVAHYRVDNTTSVDGPSTSDTVCTNFHSQHLYAFPAVL